MKPIRVLICDDDPGDRLLIKRMLMSYDDMEFVTVEAGTESEIREALEHEEIDQILLDMEMPGKSGLEWLLEIHRKEIAPVIVISGVEDDEVIYETINRGASDYIHKNNLYTFTLVSAIANSMHKWRLGKSVSRNSYKFKIYQVLRLVLKEQIDNHRKVLARLRVNGINYINNSNITGGYEMFQQHFENTIYTISEILEPKDSFTFEHQRRVKQLAGAIAREMKLPREQVFTIEMASLVHDIGKISVPLEVLNKSGRLTEEEFDQVKNHPRIGNEILMMLESPWPISEIVMQHHERIDGSGYPKGLTENEINVGSKIIAVADVVEAMSSDRSYRNAFPIPVALDEIDKNKGTLYDIQVADICRRMFLKKNFRFE
ncbi:response regulator [bacterium]|nr:response regulator [bacterium]